MNNKEKSYISEIYKKRLLHYFEQGVGNKSKITGTIITPQLIKNCLERYIELGGDEDFNNVTKDEHKEFMSEVAENEK
tara:strand:- start:253 stop:486 length:234 start_codon:yes stop_codon:yes gene_type:complete